MVGVQGIGDRFLPFLLVAVALHGAMLFIVRLDAPPVALPLPVVTVLDAALELRPDAAAGRTPVPLPAHTSVSAVSAGANDMNQGSTLAAPADPGESTARLSRGAAVSRSEQRRRRAVAPASPSPAMPDQARAQPGTGPAALESETRRADERPMLDQAAQTANGSEIADAATGRARLTSAVLDRQISEWTTAYAESRAREAALPTRTARVEKVTTHRYAADAYERDWQDKVERVGNLNYPEEARRKNLSGGLLLSVGVNADGSLKGISVARSSGHAELDEAAVRIVRLAAPFAPFPSQLKTDYDVLVITRTWRFFTDHHLTTAP